MLLQSLADYYEILAQDENSGIPLAGYSMAPVSYALVLSCEGSLVGIFPLKQANAKGKELAKSMLVPEQVKKTSGVSANFMCENAAYVLGIAKTEKTGTAKADRAKECSEAFRLLHHKILDGVDCDEARAVLAFLDSWEPEQGAEHPVLKDCLEALAGGGNIVFMLDGSLRPMHEHILIKRAWEAYKQEPDGAPIMCCLVRGEQAEVARLHPSLKGVKGAQSVGASIVSFNARAYESYGRQEEQGANAPVSKQAAFAYTTMLNRMLSDGAHRMFLGDTTMIFWALSPEKQYQDFASLFLDPSELEESAKNKVTPERFARDEHAVREVRQVLKKIGQGAPIGELSNAFDPNVSFYILGLAPNAARLSVRLFVRDSFGDFAAKVARHYEDMRIAKQYAADAEILSVWRLLNETVSPKSSDKSASPLLSGAVLRAILTGERYPEQLYSAVLIRIRAGDAINYCKAAIIKAVLIRKDKEAGKHKEELTLALNENSTSIAYLLGRLFAVLEKAQLDATPNINTTIKDRYFSSACATPASVFPVLLKLSQAHISKAEYGYTIDNRIAAIMDCINMEGKPYPAHLTLEEQGIFILGYYHQRNAFFVKKDKNNGEVQ